MAIFPRPYLRHDMHEETRTAVIPGDEHGWTGNTFIVYAVTPAWSERPEDPQAVRLPLHHLCINPSTHTITLTFVTPVRGTVYLLPVEQTPMTVHRPSR